MVAKDVSRPNADLFPMVVGIDSFSLQGTMMCKQESNGHNSASWKFAFNGHKSLLFNVENKSWTVLRPEGEPLKETLASDRAMTGDLFRIATQDCIDWLQQVSRAQGEVLSTKGNCAEGMTLYRSLEITLTLCVCACVLCVV